MMSRLGPPVQEPMSQLISMIQRDFVSYWYNASICLSPSTPFPAHTQSLLNTVLTNLVNRIRRQDPKEVSIYLFHSASNAMITQVREIKHPLLRDETREKEDLIKKVRRTSEEVNDISFLC